MRRMGLWAAALVAVWPLGARAAKIDVYALVGARILPVSGPPIATGTLVIRDGVIEAVGSQVPVPPDARVIEARGLTLTPGLIDAFGGLGLPVQRPVVVAGPAAPQPARPALEPQATVLERVRVPDVLRGRDQGVTTALVVPREGVLPGRSALLDLNGARADQMALRQPAAMHLHMTTAGRGYPSALMGTMAHTRQQLLDARTYREAWALYERAPLGRKRPRYDAALAAWQDVLDGRIPLVVTAPRENDIRRALALGDEFRVRVVVAGAARAFEVADLIKQRKLPVIVSVNFDPPRPVLGFAGDEERERLDIEEAQRNPAQLARAGIPFALGSGFGNGFLAGIRKAIEVGLPREAALRALTLDGARTLGVADRTGSLERGKLANVVAWTGEPLDRTARVKMVFVDGQLYEPPERPERPPPGEGRRDDDPAAPTGSDDDADEEVAP
jgi:imidazolonepropionase-like amidohydrolase